MRPEDCVPVPVPARPGLYCLNHLPSLTVLLQDLKRAEDAAVAPGIGHNSSYR